jgi:hypothetical protein
LEIKTQLDILTLLIPSFYLSLLDLWTFFHSQYFAFLALFQLFSSTPSSWIPGLCHHSLHFGHFGSFSVPPYSPSLPDL